MGRFGGGERKNLLQKSAFSAFLSSISDSVTASNSSSKDNLSQTGTVRCFYVRNFSQQGLPKPGLAPLTHTIARWP